MKEKAKGLWTFIKGIGGLLIAVLVVMAFFGAFDEEAEKIGEAEIFRGNDTKSSFGGASQVKVTEDGEVVEQITGSKESEKEAGKQENDAASHDSAEGKDYLEVGATYMMADGSTLTLSAAGVIEDPIQSQMIVYAIVELENKGDTNWAVSQTDADIFMDDYQYDLNNLFPITVDGSTYQPDLISINPGRKGRYAYYTQLPSGYLTADTVEMEIYNEPVLFKHDGEWLYTDPTADLLRQANEEAKAEMEKEAGKIGNAVIDANPDRYIPEGVSGRIYNGGTFYLRDGKQIEELVPGEYLIVGGGDTFVKINEDETITLTHWEGETEFENLELRPSQGGTEPSWTAINPDGGIYVVTFFETDYAAGLYLYTGQMNDENDYNEGFYLSTDTE